MYLRRPQGKKNKGVHPTGSAGAGSQYTHVVGLAKQT
jgi:hypothetical protein